MQVMEKGTFVIGLPTANQYRISKPGVLCWVKDTNPRPDPFEIMFGGGREYYAKAEDNPKMGLIPFSKENYELHMVKADKDKFRPALPEEIQSVLAKVKEAKKYLKQFKVGDSISFTEDHLVEMRFMFFSSKIIFYKGSDAIVDFNPLALTAEEHSELSDADKEKLNSTCPEKNRRFGEHHAHELIVPSIMAYVSEHNKEIPLEGRLFEEKQFDKNIMKRLVLQDGVKESIEAVLSRVMNRETNDKIYEELGMKSVCQKGRGSIVLLYGVPGSGKTMTAEAFSEHMGRPLIRAEAGDIGDVNRLKERLMDSFRRAKKYNAMILIDEVDVFIRKRGVHPMLDEMTSVFLRVLEYFDGIIFMTTNLAGNIDPAIFSRIHLCVGIESISPELRLEIWKKTVSNELFKAISGTDADKEKLFKELSEVNLNGREIKTVIQNAVTRAIHVTKNPKEKVTPQWINRRYFSEEAAFLAENKASLKKDYDIKN